MPMAMSIVRAVLRTKGMIAGLLPLPTMRNVRWPHRPSMWAKR
jgi:hypothetical protein